MARTRQVYVPASEQAAMIVKHFPALHPYLSRADGCVVAPSTSNRIVRYRMDAFIRPDGTFVRVCTCEGARHQHARGLLCRHEEIGLAVLPQHPLPFETVTDEAEAQRRYEEIERQRYASGLYASESRVPVRGVA